MFSLLNGEGAGSLLAAAAGDTAGGRCEIGYSAFTQQATVLAYHLLKNDGIDRNALADEWVELAADGINPSVYRGTTPEFDAWQAGVAVGAPVASPDPSCEPAARIAPVGVWFRRDPTRLVKASITVSRLTHLDATTAVAATALSGAVAALAFAQTGRDLFHGVAEVADRALAAIEEDRVLFSNVDQASKFPVRLRSAISWLELPGGKAIDQVLTDAEGPDWVLAAMVLAATATNEPYRQIEEGARLGGSALGAMVGALVGARTGIRPWPWVVPNDTWFAEIGRRLVSANRETRDIPVPYHVEETLTYGMEPDSNERFRLS